MGKLTQREEILLRKFTYGVIHGDLEHQQWLIDEVEKFIKKENE